MQPEGQERQDGSKRQERQAKPTTIALRWSETFQRYIVVLKVDQWIPGPLLLHEGCWCSDVEHASTILESMKKRFPDASDRQLRQWLTGKHKYTIKEDESLDMFLDRIKLQLRFPFSSHPFGFGFFPHLCHVRRTMKPEEANAFIWFGGKHGVLRLLKRIGKGEEIVVLEDRVLQELRTTIDVNDIINKRYLWPLLAVQQMQFITDEFHAGKPLEHEVIVDEERTELESWITKNLSHKPDFHRFVGKETFETHLYNHILQWTVLKWNTNHEERLMTPPELIDHLRDDHHVDDKVVNAWLSDDTKLHMMFARRMKEGLKPWGNRVDLRKT